MDRHIDTEREKKKSKFRGFESNSMASLIEKRIDSIRRGNQWYRITVVLKINKSGLGCESDQDDEDSGFLESEWEEGQFRKTILKLKK